MKKLHRIVLLATTALVLAGCAPTNCADCPVPTCAPCPSPETVVTCNPEDTSAPEETRDRGWVLLQVGDPEAAAALIMETMADDGYYGNDFVVVRADIVGDTASQDPQLYNLVVPVDARVDYLDDVAEMLEGIEGLGAFGSPVVLRVTSHVPSIPHSASTFITPSEYRDLPLPEYCPPGRHPQSPGANPWG